MHQRLEPKRHRFEYGIFMLCVELDELDSLDARLRFLSRNRRNLYEFRDSDHLQVPGADHAGGVKESLRVWLRSQGVELPPDARFIFVTLPRVAGYIFNPVSFYFCETAVGEPLCSVAQVGNTFGELKPYLVPVEGNVQRTTLNTRFPETSSFRVVVPKHYYVSPFTALDVCFDFKLRTPGEELRITVNDVSGDRTLLISTLTGTRRPLTDGQLVRLTLKYPLVTLRVIALIHWHAVKLWWKRVPWHRKAADPDLQRGVFRPHASILPKPPAEKPVPASTS